MVHGKHSAAVESVLAQRPPLVKAVPIEKARLVERGNRQRAWRPLRGEHETSFSWLVISRHF
jgi:hypothetical protein